MAKLVIVTADNSTIDVLLDRERITIGRRADNDVCLPYPAVSGEHAAVVTLLADSFLEDLGSTNGTLVNGKAVGKHFLRDHDMIDIGKQKLVYLVNEGERYTPPSAALSPLNMRSLVERVEHVAQPVISKDLKRAPPTANPEIRALAEDLESGISGLKASAEIDSTEGMEFQPQPMPGLSPLNVPSWTKPETPEGRAPARAMRAPTPANPELTQSLPPMPSIKIVSGASAGRSVPLVKDETTVGRAGLSVAAIRRTPDGFVLVAIEAKSPAKVNGRPLGEEPVLLKAGDQIEIAGTKLQLVIPARP